MKHDYKIKKTFRSFQLALMALVAIAIAPLTAVLTLMHGYGFPKSISITATIANQTGPILPFILGAFCLYALSYSLICPYDKQDRVVSIIMAIGFALVSFFPCESSYISADLETVGIIGVSQIASKWIHNIGALVGFGSLILWVSKFMKSNVPRAHRTKEKLIRNKFYKVAVLIMTPLMLPSILVLFNGLSDGFPFVFVCEAVILTLASGACAVKAGFFWADERMDENH